MSDYEVIKNTLAVTIAEELEWVGYGHVAGQKPDPIHNPWLPFQMADFIAILAECVAVSEGKVFLDVRSGIGTKLLVASTLFGLDAYGLEIDKELHQYARDNGQRWSVNHRDTEGEFLYQKADIIWMYRPYRDSLHQAKLEHRIYEEMKTGAIIAGAGFVNPPNGFEIVVDNWEDGLASAWKKPANWEPVSYDFDEDE